MKIPDAVHVARPQFASPFASAAGLQSAPRVGQGLAVLGESMMKLAAQEQDRLEETSAQEAWTALRSERLRLTYDKEAGYTSVRGTAILSRPLHEEYPATLRTAAEQLKARLPTEGARQRFQKAADGELLHFSEGVLRHTALETERAHQQGAEAELAVHMQSVSADPSYLAGALARIQQSNQEWFARNPSDDNQKLMREFATTGRLAETAIRGALLRNDTAEADELFKAHNQALLPEARIALGKDIDTKNAIVIGSEIGQQGFELARIGALSAVDVEKAMQALAGNNPTLLRIAQERMGELQKARDADRAELIGGLLLGMEGLSVPQSRRYLADVGSRQEVLSFGASPRELAIINKALESEVERRDDATWQRMSRTQSMKQFGWAEEAHARRAREEAFDTPEATARFLDVYNAPDFAKLSRNQIAALQPEIGEANVKRLLAEQARMGSEARAFRIPPALIQQAMPEELLVKSKNLEKETLRLAKRKNFEGIIQQSLSQWYVDHGHKVPPPIEVANMVAEASRQATVANRTWFGEYEQKTIPAYALGVKGEEGESVRWVAPGLVVDADISPQFIQQVILPHPRRSEFTGATVRASYLKVLTDKQAKGQALTKVEADWLRKYVAVGK